MNNEVKFIEQKPKPFPTIGQAIWITVLMFILTIIVYGPIKHILLDNIIKDIQFPILYLFTFGSILFYLVRRRKKENSSTKFNFQISNFKIIPIIVVATVAIFFINIVSITVFHLHDHHELFATISNKHSYHLYII